MANEEKFVYTECMGSGCHEQCFIKTIVQNGKIIRTEKAALGPPEGVRYGICAKGIEYAKFPYLPARLLHPLKRVGQRGEGRFEQISWEQAMGEIGAKLCEIRDKYGPESVIVNTFWCGYPGNFSALHSALIYRFIHTFGATASDLETIDSGDLFTSEVDFGSAWRYSSNDISIIKNSNLLIIWGSNPLGATRAAATTRTMLDAQENGAKLVSIGLLFDSTAAKVDQFIPIKGGTDAALALAMDRLMIEEDLHDREYMINYTVAPLLIRDDTSKLLRESDIKPGGDSGKFVYWNKLPAEPRTIPPGTKDFNGSIPDLEAKQTINGIACRTAFMQLREHLAEWTLERQESLTGVPAAIVRQLVHEFVTNKPSNVFTNFGMRYRNAREAHRAITLFSALNGTETLTIGLGGAGWPIQFNDQTILCPDGIENTRGCRPTVADIIETFKAPETKYHALLNVVANPVHAAPGRKMWIETVFPKLDLIVSYEVRLTDTGLFSDYILPDATTFERMEILKLANWLVLQEPAIAPMGEVKPPADFWHELAKSVGLGHYFDKTTEEWLAIRLKSEHLYFKVNPPITLDRLKTEKMVRLNVPPGPYNPFKAQGFLSPTGRFEFYNEDMVEAGEAMARWVPPLIHTPKRKEYPLHLMVSRHRVFMQTQFVDFPDLRAIAGNEPWMQINPSDAAPREITDGDLVEVFNDRGKLKIITRLSQVVPPGVIQMWFGYRAGEYLEGTPTMLQIPSGTAETQDDCSRQWLELVKKRWLPRPGEAASWTRWPQSMNGQWRIAGNWDVIWDNYCEVRKVLGG